MRQSQPNRTCLLYWATGLSATYRQGAFIRARARRRLVSPVLQELFGAPGVSGSPRRPVDFVDLWDRLVGKGIVVETEGLGVPHRGTIDVVTRKLRIVVLS